MVQTPRPPTKNFGLLGLHAVIAAAFFFALQYWGFNASLNMSIVWAIAGAIGASYLSWSQQTRNGGN